MLIYVNVYNLFFIILGLYTKCLYYMSCFNCVSKAYEVCNSLPVSYMSVALYLMLTISTSHACRLYDHVFCIDLWN
jgi:hypothetical protein